MLETLSADETVRYLAQVREDALRNERSELFYAEKRGIEKGLKKGLGRQHNVRFGQSRNLFSILVIIKS